MERKYAWKDLRLLPSLMSLTRVPLGAAFVLVAPKRPIVALSLLLLAGVSDILDGYLARRRREVTATGAALDPIADKLFVACVMGSLIVSGKLGLLGALLLATRELGELPLLIWFAVAHESLREQPMASMLGKSATMLQFISVAWLIFGLPSAAIWLGLTAAVGLCAAVSYVASFARMTQVHR